MVRAAATHKVLKGAMVKERNFVVWDAETKKHVVEEGDRVLFISRARVRESRNLRLDSHKLSRI